MSTLTGIACHLARLDLAWQWLVLARRFPWLGLLGLTFFLNGVTRLDLAYLTWVIWLYLISSSAVFTFSCVYIHISRRICDGESSSGMPSSGGHKKRPPRKQVGNFWVVFNSTETSQPFHLMSTALRRFSFVCSQSGFPVDWLVVWHWIFPWLVLLNLPSMILYR